MKFGSATYSRFIVLRLFDTALGAANCLVGRMVSASTPRKSLSSDNHHVGLVELIVRLEKLAECELRALPRIVEADRLVLDPPGLGELLAGTRRAGRARVGRGPLARMRRPAPASLSRGEIGLAQLSNSSQVTCSPLSSIPWHDRDRRGSEPRLHQRCVAPSEYGCRGLPSTFVGRPSLTSTIRPVAAPPTTAPWRSRSACPGCSPRRPLRTAARAPPDGGRPSARPVRTPPPSASEGCRRDGSVTSRGDWPKFVLHPLAELGSWTARPGCASIACRTSCGLIYQFAHYWSVADRNSSVATGTVLGRFDALGLDDLHAQFGRVAFGLPVELRHLFRRPYVGRGIAMAVEAPGHGQRLHLLHFRHLVDAAVAGDAGDARRHVRLVVEINVVGQPVDLHPRDGRAGRIALANQFQLGALGLHRNMAVHAGFGGGDRRVARLVHRVVTVSAVHAQVAGMQLVAVRDGLDGRVAGIDRFGWRAKSRMPVPTPATARTAATPRRSFVSNCLEKIAAMCRL